MTTRTFDRIPRTDPRSINWPVRAVLPDRAPRSYRWQYMQLDQGSEGACVGFGWTMDAAARPAPVFGDPRWQPPDYTTVTRIAFEVYHRAQKIDEWEGEQYEGSSVLAGAKTGVERGWYSEYRWATGYPEEQAQDVILTLGYKGPVVMGTNWYNNMFRANQEGFLHPSGGIAGGHCYLLTGYSKQLDAVFTPNSWGGSGQGWIKREQLAYLLANDGEACVPTRTKYRAQPA